MYSSSNGIAWNFLYMFILNTLYRLLCGFRRSTRPNCWSLSAHNFLNFREQDTYTSGWSPGRPLTGAYKEVSNWVLNIICVNLEITLPHFAASVKNVCTTQPNRSITKINRESLAPVIFSLHVGNHTYLFEFWLITEMTEMIWFYRLNCAISFFFLALYL